MIRTSFLLPVRDGAATIEVAVRSLLDQTDPDHEIVLVDDGSTDATGAIAARLAHEDARVRVVGLPPTGIVGALNAGLEACRGTYVARMDADDRCDPRRLERQIPLLEGDPGLGVVDARLRLFRDGDDVPEGMRLYAEWINRMIEPEDFDREILVESPIVHPAATFRRDVVVGLGGYRDGPFPEDYDLWLRLHAAGWRLRKVPEVLIEVRDRPERLTRVDPRYGKDAFRRARMGWLAATVLARPRRVALWGAGKEGGPWRRWLLAQGHTVVVVVDVAQRRLGGTRDGIPVVAPDALAGVDAELCLVAVGARGARAEIRAELARVRPDWTEGRHWWALR